MDIKNNSIFLNFISVVFEFSTLYYKNNKIKQLISFITVAKHQSIQKAADILRISHSTISVQIKMLEKEIGCKLFERKSNSLLLNKEGIKFFAVATDKIKSIENLYTDFKQKIEKKEKEKILTIASNEITIIHYLNPLIKKLSTRNRDLKIKIINIDFKDALYKIKSEEVDAMIYDTDMSFDPSIQSLPFLKDTYSIVLPKDVEKKLDYGSIISSQTSLEDLSYESNNLFDSSNFFKDKINLNIQYINSTYKINIAAACNETGIAIAPTKCLKNKIEDNSTIVSREVSYIFGNFSINIGFLKKTQNKTFINALITIAAEEK